MRPDRPPTDRRRLLAAAASAILPGAGQLFNGRWRLATFFGLPTLMDESLFADDRVTFQAGTHQDAVTMTLADYRKVAAPEVAYFGKHL